MTAAPLLLALLVTAGPTPRPSADVGFDEALRAAEASANMPGGEAYQKDFGRKSSKHVASALDDCLGGPVSVQSSFQVLLKVGLDGKVSTAMVRPESAVTECVRDKLKRRTFPKPAEATWKVVNVRLNP